MVKNGKNGEMVKIVKKGPKWSEMVKHSPKCSKMVKKINNDKNGKKTLEISPWSVRRLPVVRPVVRLDGRVSGKKSGPSGPLDFYT